MRPAALMARTTGLRGAAAAALLMAAVCGRANADAPAVPDGQALHAGSSTQVVIDAYGDSTTLGISWVTVVRARRTR